MERHYAALADRIERVAGHPLTMLAFLAWCIVMPEINVDVANYGISVATAFLLFLMIAPARRDRKALHAKLDDIECAIPEARSDNRRLEERIEHEIEERRAEGEPG